MYEDLILRWSFGRQDTSSLSDYNKARQSKMISLAKLSILSFQRWFRSSRLMLFFNGVDFESFKDEFNRSEPELFAPIEFVDQTENIGIYNKYHFHPLGVFWKWVPFRYDVNFHEISIDTDIVCISEPLEWFDWLKGKEPILIGPERFAKINISTCGKFATHPILRNKAPLNCGIVGHKKGHDYSDTFFEVTRYIDIGSTHNSMFIDEQGAINVWAYLLQAKGINHKVLDFGKCSWLRDFLFYILNGVDVETIHATMWHKDILIELIDVFKKRILLSDYSANNMLDDVLKRSETMLPAFRNVLINQVLEKN